MRKAWAWAGLWAAVAVVAMAGQVRAAEPFEGKVRLETVAPAAGDKPMAMEYSVKKDVIRVDTKVAGMENYALMYPTEKKMVSVMPAQKMYMEMPLGGAQAAAPEDAKKPEITKTDKTEKIAFKADGTSLKRVKAGEEGGKSYDAEQWTVKTDQGTTELWFAKGLAPLVSLAETFKAMPKSPTATWAGADKLPGYPYKIVTKDADGKLTSETIVNEIDTKPLDDALFKVPAEYKKFEMPKMPAKE